MVPIIAITRSASMTILICMPFVSMQRYLQNLFPEIGWLQERGMCVHNFGMFCQFFLDTKPSCSLPAMSEKPLSP